MAPAPEAPRSLVVLGTISGDADLARTAAEAFLEPWGGVLARGEAVAYDHTPYYEAELGPNLVRRFWAARGLAPAEELMALKARSAALEGEHARDGRRRVNLDPGLLDTKVVLASAKAGPQKLYLGRGTWADTLLYWDHGAFVPLPWTFPDLRAGAHVAFFTRLRGDYKRLLRRGRRG